MSLMRLEAAIWDLMVNKQKKVALKLPAELHSFRQVTPKFKNLQKSERVASAQTTAMYLWAKRQGWEEKMEEDEEHINSIQNQSDTIAKKKKQLCNISKEYNPRENSIKDKDDTKQEIGLGGCLDEFNFLYNSVEASLEEFWNR